MLLIRVAFLDFLVCFHVIGAAVLFRRLFPRESPWLGFVVPIVAVTAAFNFFEHFIALPNLGWLLPVTLAGMIWNLAKPGYSWEGLRFPSILFVITFMFVLFLKCERPDIRNYTEAGVDLTRVLNYCMGEKVPPTDCWMPPYDYGGYYTFQHYGASILKRVFSVDVGTAVNLSFALLLALVCQMGAAVAYSISGKKWISVAILPVLLSGSAGCTPFLLLMGYPDYALSTDVNSGWDNPAHNPFSWICKHDQFHPDLTLVTPLYTIYCSEFHANLGATFLTMAVLLAAFEAYRAGRFNWPWICLLVFPLVIMVTSAWYFIIATLFCVAGLGVALLTGKRPENWKTVVMASAIGLIFIWPSFYSLSGTSFTQSFLWTAWQDRTPLWIFAIQWWPIFLPWLFLCFVWHKLDWMCRLVHAAVPFIFIGMEFVSLGDRGITVQKMWGDLFGISLITFFPLVFMRKGLFFRSLTVLLIGTFIFCLGGWLNVMYYNSLDPLEFCRLQGDAGIQCDPQQKRILQVLSSLHGETVLSGKCYWSYYEAPLAVSFSENRCYIAYLFQEEECGHGGETDYRNKQSNDFYSGAMTSPLPFLRSNNIAAVLIWPEDTIPDTILQQIQTEIGSEYFYVDCKGAGVNNAGVFMRQTAISAVTPDQPPTALDLAPHATP